MPYAASKDAEEATRYWRLAAVLFIGGGLGAAPSDALHQPGHPATIYLLPLLAIVSGLVCLALAGRLGKRWLHLVAVVATLEVALTVRLADPLFAIYYTFIALYASYVFRSRAAIAFHVGFASLAVLAPIAYDPGSARETLTEALVLVPTLLLAAGTVTVLREQLEASELRYRNLAYRDPLTGLGNYRTLTERLPEEVDRHRRHRRSLALLVIDLDDFKRVNDEHGHQFGDGVLERVGIALRGAVRTHDLVVRQGGDEFSVVAPETDGPGAAELGDRVCEALAGVVVGGRAIGGTVGWAIYPDDAESSEDLLARADVRLRAAKDEKPWLSRSFPYEERLDQPRSAPGVL